MKSAAVFLTLAATVVLARVTDGSDVGRRRANKREKRDFGPEPGLSPSVGFGFGPGPFFISGPDSDPGLGVAPGRDFASGLGRSSGLKYGPGLGLSTRAAPSAEDLEPAPSSPSPSSAAPADRPGGPREDHQAVGTGPRYATTAGPVPAPATRDAPRPAYVPAPYPARFDGPVPAADPFVVAAISYGPSDPGYVPSVLGYGPFVTGHGPSATSHDGARTFAYGGRAQTADRPSPSSGGLLFGFDYKK